MERGICGPPPRALASHSDRRWAVAAHLSTFVNAFTGFLGPVVAFVIWLAKRKDSPMAARHALRSMVYQTIWIFTIAAGWAVATALTAVLVGFLLYPVMVVVTVAPFIHSVFAAVGAWRERKVYL